MTQHNRRVRSGICLLALPLCLLAQTGTPAQAAHPRLRNHFDFDTVLGEPGYFDFLVLGDPVRSEWRVTTGMNPPSSPNAVSQIVADRPSGSIAAAVRRNMTFRDGTLSVALQKGSGRGGVLFRLADGKDPKDYCVVLVDQSTGEARLTVSHGGRSTETGRGKAELENDWGVLSVTADGPKIEARWDGKPLLQGTDPKPAAGRAAMATDGPGMTTFDEFILESADRR